MALTDNLVAWWRLDETSGNRADEINSHTLTGWDTDHAALVVLRFVPETVSNITKVTISVTASRT